MVLNLVQICQNNESVLYKEWVPISVKVDVCQCPEDCITYWKITAEGLARHCGHVLCFVLHEQHVFNTCTDISHYITCIICVSLLFPGVRSHVQ